MSDWAVVYRGEAWADGPGVVCTTAWKPGGHPVALDLSLDTLSHTAR